jgi:hypothetical protein
MTKRDKKYRRIEEMKERIRKAPSDILLSLYNSGYMGTEGQIAYREVLEERGDWPNRLNRKSGD